MDMFPTKRFLNFKIHKRNNTWEIKRKELKIYARKKNDIKTVEVFYNQDNEKFDKFLQSVVRDYVSEDITEPDEEDEDFIMTIA